MNYHNDVKLTDANVLQMKYFPFLHYLELPLVSLPLSNT